MASKNYVDEVSANPVKRFFVEMLTRDISLEDAILDLLDNCVDGIQRSVSTATLKKKSPYGGYEASIIIGPTSFCIKDNCGGIPWDLRKRAFKIGRGRDEVPATVSKDALMVGAYGIGMKRAIFKLGRQAIVQTETEEDAYEVVVPKGWMDDESTWSLQTRASKSDLGFTGTKLTVSDLLPDVSSSFKDEIFRKSLHEKISTHFAIIISKGFSVVLDFYGTEIRVKPKAVALHFQESVKGKTENEIRPYIFHSEPEVDLEVTVFVGLREPIPDVEAILAAQEEPRFSTDYAGVTVICNDRVVLYCNRDELTGWGSAKIPSYHTQFIAISGFVEFKGNPAKLPTTTTKRGLEYSSRRYQQVLDRIRDGLRIFIDYTNWWKSNYVEAKSHVASTPALSFAELKAELNKPSLRLTAVRTGLQGQQYRPSLPRPEEESSEVRISYSRPREDVMRLAEFRLRQFDTLPTLHIPRALGEELFDAAFRALR